LFKFLEKLKEQEFYFSSVTNGCGSSSTHNQKRFSCGNKSFKDLRYLLVTDQKTFYSLIIKVKFLEKNMYIHGRPEKEPERERGEAKWSPCSPGWPWQAKISMF
jgi:hypothetical protein